MKYSAFNYNRAFLVLFVILAFGVFEGLSANWQIAAYLTIPLLPLVFIFKNTYQIRNDYLAISSFGKTHRKIWIKDIEKLEMGKTLFGKKLVKVFYDPYNYLSVKIGEQSEAFVKELEKAREGINV